MLRTATDFARVIPGLFAAAVLLCHCVGRSGLEDLWAVSGGTGVGGAPALAKGGTSSLGSGGKSAGVGGSDSSSGACGSVLEPVVCGQRVPHADRGIFVTKLGVDAETCGSQSRPCFSVQGPRT